MKKSREAIVRLDGRPVGRLVEQGKQITFRYDAHWLADVKAVPVSVTLPLRRSRMYPKGCTRSLKISCRKAGCWSLRRRSSRSQRTTSLGC